MTLPIYSETVDTIEQLQNGFYRIGTLDRGGWERWFLNSTQKETSRLLRNLEFVKNIEEGLGNVTKPYFLFPYAFIGSKAQLNYVIQSNYTEDKMLSRRSALHISDECFALFGVSFAYQLQSVYRQKLDDGLLMLQQSGIVEKIKNDVRWDMLRSSTGTLLQISTGKPLKMTNQEERGLTLVDTEGMFLLLGIGFLVAGGVLISEWVGGCTNKCMQIMKIKKEQKQEEHRVEEEARQEEEYARVEAEDVARLALTSASSVIGITFLANSVEEMTRLEVVDDSSPVEVERNSQNQLDSSSSKGSKHSRSSSINIADLNPAMLTEMFRGPKERPSNIVMINGKMMSENDATKYMQSSNENDERSQRESFGATSDVSKAFSFLNQEPDDEDDDEDMKDQKTDQVCRVEINFQVSSPVKHDIEECFGEKIDN